ncbi:hypothetical protein Hanom_Chr14g01283221 [Helianthus anomalus]
MHVSARGATFQFTPCISIIPSYPRDPQMGGPSKAAPMIDTTPATFAQPPPPVGFENPIPTYPVATEYNPFDPSTPMGYNYQAQRTTPMQKRSYTMLCTNYPFPPCLPSNSYPNYGYPYPAPPQPQPLPPQQLEAINKALERVEDVQRRAERSGKKTGKFFKKMTKLIKGKKDE